MNGKKLIQIRFSKLTQNIFCWVFYDYDVMVLNHSLTAKKTAVQSASEIRS